MFTNAAADSLLGSLIFTLHGFKYSLSVPFENPKDYSV